MTAISDQVAYCVRMWPSIGTLCMETYRPLYATIKMLRSFKVPKMGQL